MSYNPQNPNGQAASANSSPVVLASDQSAVAHNLAKVNGSTVVTAGTGIQQVGVADGSGNAITSTSNALDVNIKSGGNSGGVSATDEGSWTAGSSTFAPVGGVFNDSAAALTSGQEGTARLTNNRGVHANIRNSAGTELATSGNPLRIDPTGTTTQPVSGTVTANAGTNLNTSALALESGGNLAAVATNTSGLNNTVGTAGSAIPSKGVVVQGSDGTNARALKTDASGNVGVNIQNTPTVTVSGSVTTTPPSNASVNVSQVAGGTASNAGQTGALQVGGATATNTAVSSATNPLLIAGSDYGGTPKVQSLKVDSSGTAQVAVTNTPTVTANAGTNLNTSALALESGGNLATIASKATNLTPAQGSTTSGQSGPLAQTATTTAAPTYTTATTNPLSTDTSGNLRTSVNNTVTVSGTITTTPPSNASTNITQVGGSSVALGQTTMANSIPVTLASNQSAFSDNITQFGGTNVSTGTGASGAGIPRVTVSNDSNVLATQSGTWTVQPGNTANTTPWLVSLSPSTSGGWLTAAYNGTAGSPALTNTVVSVKSSAGQFGGYMFYNPNSAAVYIQVFNAATGSVTLGTTNPTYVIPLPANGAANVEFANGIAHGTAISVAATTTASGSTAPTTALNGFILFK